MRGLSIYGVAIFFLLVGSVEAATEIQYGHVEEVHDTDLHIQYKGPAGEQHFTCDVRTVECEDVGTTTPDMFPDIAGATNYANSPDGRLGIVGTSLEVTPDTTLYTHTVYDVSGDTAKKIATVPYMHDVSSYKFSWAGDHVTLFTESGDVLTYRIAERTIGLITPRQSSFPLKSLSPHGSYVSAYNYTEQAHTIWHTRTGQEISIESETPAFVEFSQDETFAAFVDDRDGYQTLYITDVGKESSEIARVFTEDFTVEDYLWFQNKLYAVGNTAANPYRWVLYQYDPRTSHTNIVAEDVSYGDYIRPIGEYALSFLTIEGKNSHVALYDAKQDTVRTIRPVADSPASSQINRSVVSFADDVKGVLYTPQNPDRTADLFVWLHGGPKRQTSFGYHSYLSYAVYDELLEKLVESGAYVLKLDYAGSYGHGSPFMDQLTNNLGKIDVAHVVNASLDIQQRFSIKDTYLIGNSYGGYLGPRVLVEHEENFAGAIAINGVYDWFDLLARIPSSPFKVYFDGLADLEDLETNFAMYEDASIVKYLPDLSDTKKLLLIYGEDDATVPTWQTEEFFYQANILDKNVTLLTLPGEGHIIRERESLQTLCKFIVDNVQNSEVVCG